MSKKAETFSPTALLKVVIKDKGVGTPDFCTVGEIKLVHNNCLETVMRWKKNNKAAVYRDKNGYWRVEWHLEKFDKDFFEINQPLIRPNWSYIVTSDLVELPITITHEDEDGSHVVDPQDIEILDFRVIVKEDTGCIATYPFLQEQLDDYKNRLLGGADNDYSNGTGAI